MEKMEVKVTTTKPWPLGAITIRIDGLLHFYACITDIKAIHSYIDDTTPANKYTIDVLVNNTTIKLQYSDKQLSADVLEILDKTLEGITI
jgi:hypothetical protein